MNHSPHICHPLCKPRFTEKQGQYLAFIHAYCRIMGQPPAEADMQRHFKVTPPTELKSAIRPRRRSIRWF